VPANYLLRKRAQFKDSNSLQKMMLQ